MNPTKDAFLLVDDDPAMLAALSTALRNRGLEAYCASDGATALQIARQSTGPLRVIADMKLPDLSGLFLVNELMKTEMPCRIVILTGYGSIPTAIQAIKLGALNYFTKPAPLEQVLAAFDGVAAIEVPAAPIETPKLSVGRVEWEYIQRVLQDVGGNISEAARSLRMHRRTLQRKLSKRPPTA